MLTYTNHLQEHKERSPKIDVDMWNAAERGDADMVRNLLQQGADPNHKAGVTGHLPVLHVSIFVVELHIFDAFSLNYVSLMFLSQITYL
jgi:hypothetical protein